MTRTVKRISGKLLIATLLCAATPVRAQDEAPAPLSSAAVEAQRQLRQTFTNLSFDDFGPAPVRGPIYQAVAGGRIIYFAPESQHLLFAAIYDKNGVNLTALAQDASARKRLGAIDPADALVIGPPGAPRVIEFTDPDCPYCQALERFWVSKSAEDKPVQRLIYFVSGIHPQAAAKAEHILCSPDPEAEFKAIYAGAAPATLKTCPAGAAKVARDAETVRKMGISGTPTLFIDGKLVSGFRQAELEAFLAAQARRPEAVP
ncbi:DsbC family protein [Novosphingobium profundi]|uniref:DsbC family protein n=1 Tax=Novosphingobium profundi TaxID=1774954 RepID=UPI001BD94EE0|nr:DsbC family protein [Novosphingobium profundi]MBT0667394.1 DsbC family protein [Novosphingobium profundi]